MGNVTEVAPAGVFGLPTAGVFVPTAVAFEPTVCLLTAPPQEIMAAASAKVIVIAAIVRAIA